MKKTILALTSALLLCLGGHSAYAKKDKNDHSGWGFGILPCATYSSDMGFQYGVFGDFYYYGDGSTYPNYRDKISYEASHFTKGRTRLYLAYDSKHLIPGVRSTASVTYIDDPLYNFWGFNGAASPLYKALESNKDYQQQIIDGTISSQDALRYTTTMGVLPEPGKGVSYYHMNRGILRLLADFQGQITPQLRWAGGINFWAFRMGNFDEKYGYDLNSTLYNHYKKFGVIKETEANGGNRLELKAGLVFDSRDFETAPNKGIWAEIYFNGSPDLFGDGFNYLKLNAHFRHYVTLPFGFKQGDPVFAYHLAYLGTVAGEAPFYMQQNINALILKQMMSEGLGSSNTIRGTRVNRMIADGYAWANFELRVKLVNFSLFGQSFYLATNPFLDCGLIVQPYRVSEMATLPEINLLAVNAGYQAGQAEKYIRDMAGTFVCSGGIGLKLAWNENFIVSVECAHNFNEGLGDPFWMSIGTNYNF